MMFRHGLRVSEACGLRWDAVDLAAGLLHVSRLKHGVPSTHPLRGPELRALRELRRDWPNSPYLFCSERGAPLTPRTVRAIVARAGIEAGLSLPVHPHMLRHSLGFKTGERWPGHAQHSVVPRPSLHYSHGALHELSPDRFKTFFRD